VAAGEGGKLRGTFSGGVIIFCCGGLLFGDKQMGVGAGFLAKLFLSNTNSARS